MPASFSFFTELNREQTQNVVVANGNKLQVKGIGQGEIKVITPQGKTDTLLLTKVLYIPELTDNLLSVSAATSNGCKVTFKRDWCTIERDNTALANGILVNGMYRLHLDDNPQTRTFKANVEKQNHCKNKNCLMLWHDRLGHRNIESIKKIRNENLARGLSLNNCSHSTDCVQCIQGKLTETPFPKKTEYRATETLQLVHSDICGPLPTNSLSGKRYFITFTDDYSRYTKIYLLKGKDEAYEKIKDYVISAHTEFGKNIQTIRTDNGREYVNRQVEDFLNQSGIKHQLTVPYSPAQNGVAERKNRSLMEMTRCMLFDSGLPQSLWAEAVTTANYLHNRIPSKATDKTPFELWTNRKPSLKHLKRFGCKAFAYIPKIKRNKLDSKVIEGIFLGYDDRSKGYRILHDTDNITISRSVKFLEKENGFHHASTKTTSPQVLSTDLTSSNHIGNAEESQEPGTQPENLEDSETEDYLQPGTSTGTQVVTQRRSTRPTKGIPPIRNDYMLYKTEAQDIPTPTSYSEVLQLPKIEREKWLQAMNEELNSLEKNNVWELTPLPKDKKIIGCKWTYKQKLNSKGEIERYKARLVAKGFNQKFGRDYEETFAPIVKHSTIRAFLAASVYKGMKVIHLDVKTAFLHGDLDKELYMELPEGLHTKQTNKVCKLKKAIYGLKQAGRSWNTKIASTLIKNNFKQSIVDPCLFTKNEENHSIYLILYVDDMLLASDSEIIIQNTVKTLEKEFEIKNLGDPTQFIGIEISRNREGELLLSQKNKIQELVERYNLQEAKPTFTPMESRYPGISDEKLLPNNVQYQQLIGSLLYLSVVSRPDIAAPVCILSSRNQNPRNCDWNAAKRIVRYLKTTKELELRISNQKPPTLEAYSDATWASDNTDRKSLSGNLFLLGSNPISWMTGKQGCVSLSSTEAELISAAEASQELLWLLDLLKDLELEQKAPIYFHQDNQSCLKICSSEKVSSRTKHIATKIHHLKDLQKKTVIKMGQEEAPLSLNIIFYQQDKDSIADFVASLRRDIADCEFKAQCECGKDVSASEFFLRAQFIRGIKDNWIKEQILQSEIYAFNAILTKAIALEASKTDCHELSKARPSTTTINVTDEVHKTNHIDNYEDFGINRIVDIYDQPLLNASQDTTKYYVSIKIEGFNQKFEVDTGAGYTLMPENQFKKLNTKNKVQPTNIVFRSYTGNVFNSLGKVEVQVEFKDRTSIEELFIIPNNYDPILGRTWIRHLKINLEEIDQENLNQIKELRVSSINDDYDIEKEFPEIYTQKVGCVPDFLIMLQLIQGAKPSFTPERNVPYALREKVEKELDTLEAEGIISKAATSDWGSQLVVIPKGDGTARLCVDYKVGVNDQLVNASYPIKRIEDVLNSLKDSKYFCRLDLYKAYLHLRTDEESSIIQTISTHRGTYRMNRLSFGIKTAPAEFNRVIDQILQGLNNTISYFDNILVHGKSKQECKENLFACLERLRACDLHLNKNKCIYFQTKIEYLGHVIENNKILKSPSKITIIFKANGLLDIVNGKSLFEDLKDETGKDKWSLKDAKAQKYIMLTIEKNVLTHILNCKTSKEMYEKLVAIYQREDEQLKCKLLQEFHGFKFDKNTDMATNISRLQNLVFKLNNVKQEIEESFVISKILSILPDYFNYFSTAWDSTPKSYAPNGYRLWDEQSKQIFTARDVIFLDKGCINKEEKMPIVEPEEESEDQLELNEEPSLPEVSEDKEDIPTKPSTSKYNLRPRSSIQTPSRYEDFYLEQDGTTESALLTYSEAISGPNQEKWKKAIKEEKESLAKNEVWEIVKENEASNKKILTSKWLFKVKEDGRYKARLVVRGFEQEAGIDYDETFSPVISTVSLRIYFALMAKRRQAIGSLLYLTNKTRPDMTFATNFESRSMHDPTTQDIINIKRTLRYLNHTTNLGISYDGEMPFELNVYCDSDFAGDIKTRKNSQQKQLARRYCTWKNIDKDIENLVKSCKDCLSTQNNPPKAPVHHWDPPSTNWERIHLDYGGPFQGYYYLVLIDAKSRWAEIKAISEPPTSLLPFCHDIICIIHLSFLLWNNGDPRRPDGSVTANKTSPCCARRQNKEGGEVPFILKNGNFKRHRSLLRKRLTRILKTTEEFLSSTPLIPVEDIENNRKVIEETHSELLVIQ
ncbi:hypothetical protein LAZ67_13003282, partial [Cordylochernes scorpioides]